MTAETKAQINAWVEAEKGNILSDLRQLVQIDSSTAGAAPEPGAPFGAGAAEALDFMLRRGAEFGFRTENLDGYCGTISLDGEGGETIGLFSHLDVVPVGSGWTYPPFAAERTADFLIGRGAMDNKGPAVATLYLLKYLSSQGIKPRHGIMQYLGCQEESGMSDLDHFLQKKEPPALAMIPDLSFPICYAEKGMLSFRYRVPLASEQILSLHGGAALNIVPGECAAVLKCGRETLPADPRITVRNTAQGTEWMAVGKSSHSAFPEGSVNAIGILLRAISSWNGLEQAAAEPLRVLGGLAEDHVGRMLGIEEKSEEFGGLTCVFSLIQLESGVLSCDFNIRYPHYLSEEELQEKLRRFAAQHGWTLSVLSGSAGSYFPKEHPAVALLEETYQQWTGLSAPAFTTGGGTYARKLPHAFAAGLGMPGYASKAPDFFPPGHGGAHQPDEALELAPFFLAVKILIAAVLELDQLDRL